VFIYSLDKHLKAWYCFFEVMYTCS
jgi:hypothetical protein